MGSTSKYYLTYFVTIALQGCPIYQKVSLKLVDSLLTHNNLLYLIVGKLNNIDSNIKKETSMTQTAYLYCIGYILLDKFA